MRAADSSAVSINPRGIQCHLVTFVQRIEISGFAECICNQQLPPFWRPGVTYHPDSSNLGFHNHIELLYGFLEGYILIPDQYQKSQPPFSCSPLLLPPALSLTALSYIIYSSPLWSSIAFRSRASVIRGCRKPGAGQKFPSCEPKKVEGR